MYIQLRGIPDANWACFLFFCLTSEGGVIGQSEPRRVLCDVSQVQPATGDSSLNRALILCNPATSDPSDSDARKPEPQGGGFLLPAAAPQQAGDEDAGQRNVALQILVKCLGFSYGSPRDSHGVFRNTGCCIHGLKAQRQWRRRSNHMSCFTVWLIQVETIQAIPRATDPPITWRIPSTSRSVCCCPFLERPCWLWSAVWPCWCTTQSACVAPGAAASCFTWILASLYWLWFCYLPHAFHRSGLLASMADVHVCSSC